MIIFHRLGPVLAALVSAAAFIFVFLWPSGVYAAGAACLLLLWWIVAPLPAGGVGERLQRWLAYSLPLLSGGWLWVLTDMAGLRQWLPVVTSLLVLLTGEVVFQSAYRRSVAARPWMAGVAVTSGLFLCTSLSLATLLMGWSPLLVGLAGGLVAIALLHYAMWVYEQTHDPWWVTLLWFIMFSQLTWAIVQLPTTYPAQAVALFISLMVGLRFRLAQRLSAAVALRPLLTLGIGLAALVIVLGLSQWD